MKPLAFLLLLAACRSASAQATGAVQLLGHYIPPRGGEYVSGCWGWTDTAGGREYALLGCQGGTSIVEITRPGTPEERGFVPGPFSRWREIQTNSHYAYVVSEGGGGTQIIDLSFLPDSVHLAGSFTFELNGRNTLRSHTIHCNGCTMYLNGCANWPPGGIVIFSLADPEHPAFQSACGGRYVHDCFVRRDTLFAATIAEGGVDMFDVSDKLHPEFIDRFTYPGAGTHNCATTDDGAYLLTTDEINAAAKTLKIWDLHQRPEFPMAAEFQADPRAIVHNVFVRGDLAVISYYTAGMRVADVADPRQPVDVGGYDTYAGDDGGMIGAWSAYPFFPSRNIIIGDMTSGLTVVRLDPHAPQTPHSVRAATGDRFPTRIGLTWTDPRGYLSGAPLGTFTILVERDGAPLARAVPGAGSLADTGLAPHSRHTYAFRTIAGTDTSPVVRVDAYAGGHPQPAEPSGFLASPEEEGILLTWRNPSGRRDGSSLGDFAGILVERDGVVIDSILQSPGDAGRELRLTDRCTGYHAYRLRAFDGEDPPHSSEFTPLRIACAGFRYGVMEGFESGAASVYRTGLWDTVHTLASEGESSITDSPGGDYTPGLESSFMLEPVVATSNIILRFSHIAILRLPAGGILEIARNPSGPFEILAGYNSDRHDGWRDLRADPDDWYPESFDLGRFAGDTVTVRFRIRSFSGVPADGWYVDGISLGPATGAGSSPAAPEAGFSLGPNYPNPFNSSTRISYTLQERGDVTVEVFDLLGRLVERFAEPHSPPGNHAVTWDAGSCPSGIYCVRMTVRSARGERRFSAGRTIALIR